MGRRLGSKAKVITDEIIVDANGIQRRSDGTYLPGQDSAKTVRFMYSEDDKALLKYQFLEAYAEHDSLRKAARVVGINRKTVMEWRKEDNEFNEALIAAHEDSVDEVESSLKDVALSGKNEGARVTAATVYLNAHRPSLYKGTRRDGDEDSEKKVEFHFHIGKPPEQRQLSDGNEITVTAQEISGEA